MYINFVTVLCSNNTNKLSPQERSCRRRRARSGSNNTNKLSPQEHEDFEEIMKLCSNNTNKLSPQEQRYMPRVSL